MPIRNRIRVDDYLVVDDESGEVRYRSELRKRWDGLLVQRKGWETRQPQEFVQPGNDPTVPTEIRAEEALALPNTTIGVFIGASNVPVPTNNAAAHLFNPGIGSMRVGFSFIVR